MEKSGSAIVLIILGLIVLAFPLLGLIPLSLITGFVILVLGLGLILGGIGQMGESAGMGILILILGIIALILGFGFIFNPGLFAWLAGFIVYIVGLFLVIAGIVGIISKADGSRWNGVIALIVGILYIIIGAFITNNPIVLGVLIGLWLLISGIMMLFIKD